MKSCHKWMVACVLIALAIIFVLPRLGVSLPGAALLIPLLMIGCCVLPMLFMMRSGQGKDEASCCSKKEHKGEQENKGVAENVKSSSGSCH